MSAAVARTAPLAASITEPTFRQPTERSGRGGAAGWRGRAQTAVASPSVTPPQVKSTSALSWLQSRSTTNRLCHSVQRDPRRIATSVCQNVTQPVVAGAINKHALAAATHPCAPPTRSRTTPAPLNTNASTACANRSQSTAAPALLPAVCACDSATSCATPRACLPPPPRHLRRVSRRISVTMPSAVAHRARLKPQRPTKQ